MPPRAESRPAWTVHFEKNLQVEYIHTTPMSVESVEPMDDEIELKLEYDGGLNPESYEESVELLWNVARMSVSHEVDRPIDGDVVTSSGTTILSFRVEPEWCQPDNPYNFPAPINRDPSVDEIHKQIIETV